MKRTYELVLVFDPGLEVAQIETDLRKLQESISATGLVRKWERWGKRRLSYEIKGRQYGYYVLAVFDLDPAAVAELDRGLRINASVIRHLTTLMDPKRVPEPDHESVRTLGAKAEEGEESTVRVAAVETVAPGGAGVNAPETSIDEPAVAVEDESLQQEGGSIVG